jgi:SAM-dependent methyltransferase
MPPDKDQIQSLAPTKLVQRFGAKIVACAAGRPIVDVACGSGRNAVFLSLLGSSVVCVDRDLTAIRSQQKRLSGTSMQDAFERLTLMQLDLVQEPWPFGKCSIGGIINIHFLAPMLFKCFENSLLPGGCLLLETVPGCGGNYRQLPKAGELRTALEEAFDFRLYRERRAGPLGYQAATVQVFAQRLGLITAAPSLPQCC